MMQNVIDLGEKYFYKMSQKKKAGGGEEKNYFQNEQEGIEQKSKMKKKENENYKEKNYCCILNLELKIEIKNNLQYLLFQQQNQD